MTKTKLMEQVLAHLKRELDTLTRAALEAHETATHSENKQENKYDTRGLEASYLAAGQSKRAAEIQGTIEKLKSLPLAAGSEAHASVRAGSVVDVERDAVTSSYFVLPYVGGINVSEGSKPVKVISVDSPLGRELLGRAADEEFTFNGKAHLIASVR